MTNKILIEICCGSVDDAIEAQAGGADRIELNSGLFLGGLTPSIGTVKEVKDRVSIPVMVMIRPRGGGFCYTDTEVSAMEYDAKLALEHGADGIVFGFLKEDGVIDLKRCERLMKVIGDREAVFHRAFDVTPDPFAALDQLVDMGVKRILTSGQENSVYNGANLIKELVKHAGDRIEILPGGGINMHNIEDIVQRTRCSQVHMGAFKKRFDTSTSLRPHVYFGGSLFPPEDSYNVIDSETVKTIRRKLGE